MIINELGISSLSWVSSLFSLLIGGASPFAVGRTVWLEAAPFPVAYSWVLVIAFAGAYIAAQTLNDTNGLRKIKGGFGRMINNWPVTVAIIGILWLGLGLIMRAAPGGEATRYFYPFYVLLIPASALIISKISNNKRVISTILIVIMISVGSFYSLQIPTGQTENVILVADKRSWIVGATLARNASASTAYVLDTRVGVPFDAITRKTVPALYYYGSASSFTGSLVVFSPDRLGEQFASFNLESNVLQGILNNSYDIVYSDGLYEAVFIPR
jgi:hypothetical protein